MTTKIRRCVREQLEHDVQTQCLEYLKANGIFAWRNNTGCAKIGKGFVRFGLKGSSDILGICPDGRFLAIECKRTKGGVISNEQKDFHEVILRNGGVSLFVNSLDSMINQLKENNVKTLQDYLF